MPETRRTTNTTKKTTAKTITSKERAQLRSQAQSLSAVVMVGHDGITEGVINALDAALTDHELVKVRFQDFKDMARELSTELASIGLDLLEERRAKGEL